MRLHLWGEMEVGMALREKYAHAIQTAKGFKMDGAAEERDGKLHFKGTVTSEAEKNAIWDALKTVPDWKNDVVADITVKSGDTLSGISKEHLGDAKHYMRIFEANKDQLSDPDKITHPSHPTFALFALQAAEPCTVCPPRCSARRPAARMFWRTGQGTPVTHTSSRSSRPDRRSRPFQ